MVDHPQLKFPFKLLLQPEDKSVLARIICISLYRQDSSLN